MGDHYSYSFPGGLSIEYSLDNLIIRANSSDPRTGTLIILPLNDITQNNINSSFIFEEEDINSCAFTGVTSGNIQYKLHVDHNIYPDMTHIMLDINIRDGDDDDFDDNYGYNVLNLTRDASPQDAVFFSRLLDLGRAVRDGTPLPASHGIEGPAPAPALAPELRNLPANATNAITYDPIVNGTNMVNFQGEFDHGRYYKRNTFAQLPAGPNGRKRNPYTQQNIMNTRSYRARIPQPAEGGRRRKTRRRRRSKKN
jgi:hypothetical protein